MAPSFDQSLPLCYALSAVGGILEVGATAVLAVPDARKKEGVTLPQWLPKVALASNVTMQLLGSLASNLVAPWFGPVSVVAPIYFSATLVSNMIIFGFLLGLEFFTRTMCTGTYVIFIGSILLQVVGPGIQDGQDIGVLLNHVHAFAWFSFLLLSMGISTLLMMHGISDYREYKRIIILLVARSSSYTLNLTVSRAFLLNPSNFVLAFFMVIKIVSGSIYTYAIVVQATAVTQSKFVPLNATIIILINAVTGIIIWEDWKVISSWVGYVCIFLLLALGCDLLLSSNLLTNENPDYGVRKRTSIILESEHVRRIVRFSLVRSGGSRNLYANIPAADTMDDKEVEESESSNGNNKINDNIQNSVSNQSDNPMIRPNSSGDSRRKSAWKSIINAAIATNKMHGPNHV